MKLHLIRISAAMVIVFMISITACFESLNESTAVELQKTGNVTIPVHSAIHLDDVYRLSFDRVSEDSRCPVDVICVWTGNARMVLTLTGPGDDEMPVEFNSSNPMAYENAGWRLEWVELAPAPRSDQPVDSNAYEITLNIQRISE